MTRISLIALAAAGLLAATGCTSANRVVGNNLIQVGHWYGELGITGHHNKITVRAQSRITKLSILGSGNEVTVEDHATLGKIEIWGADNTVSIPAHLVVRINQCGDGSRVVRRMEHPAAAAMAGTQALPPPGIEEGEATEEAPAEPTAPPPSEAPEGGENLE